MKSVPICEAICLCVGASVCLYVSAFVCQWVSVLVCQRVSVSVFHKKSLFTAKQFVAGEIACFSPLSEVSTGPVVFVTNANCDKSTLWENSNCDQTQNLPKIEFDQTLIMKTNQIVKKTQIMIQFNCEKCIWFF